MTTDPIAAARALIAAQPDLLFRCDLCPDECNCHPHHDMSMSGEYVLCDGCEDFDNPKGVPDPLTLIATLADAVEAERARAEKAETGRDEWKDEYQTAARLLNLFRDAAFNRQIERDQALARVAAAYEAAAELVALDHVCDAIRALTPADAQAALDKLLTEAREAERAKVAAAFAMQDAGYSITTPADAQAALDKMLAEARAEGWRAGRDAAADAMQPALRSMLSRGQAAAAILALPEPKEASHDD